MMRLLAPTALALVVLTTGALAAMHSKRIVTAVDEAAKTFACGPGPGEPSWTYKTTDKTVIRTSGQRVRLSHIWHRGNFSDIKVGGRVTVRYHLIGHDRVADRITVYPMQQ
jgi:hypothetical protein